MLLRKKLNILAFPYRDEYFRSRYGAAVRDLQILEALVGSEEVERVLLVNRPVSVYERLLGKRFRGAESWTSKVDVIDTTSFDLLGPLTRRKWLENCYSEYGKIDFRREGSVNVILDFTPLSMIDYQSFNADIVWYDLIDSFEKHNRFDDEERALVRSKLTHVGANNAFITGVSRKALQRFPDAMVLPNAAGQRFQKSILGESGVDATFDFGFIGFVTDKFDVNAIKVLADAGYKVAVFGEFYNRGVRNDLSQIPDVHIGGRFNHSEIDNIVRRFRVGLIPYKNRLLHDESPLKLYQYIKNGIPVLTSANFELNYSVIAQYDETDNFSIRDKGEAALAVAHEKGSRTRISNLLDRSQFWDTKIADVISRLRSNA